MSDSSEDRQARLKLRGAAQDTLSQLDKAGPTFDAVYPPTNDMASVEATEAAKAQSSAFVESLREAMKVLEKSTEAPPPTVGDDD